MNSRLVWRLGLALGLLPLAGLRATADTPTATPGPANLPQPLASVLITDTGFDPPSVTVALEGAVQFTNASTNVHSATSQSYNGWRGFDTGGLARGQAFTVGFAQAGTF